MGDYITNILILSDLHFNHEEKYEGNRDLYALREECLTRLQEKMVEIKGDKNWKPHIIAITGDIGYSGNHADYLMAGKWLFDLRKTLDINTEHIVMCPGNHDVDRNKTKNMYYPPDNEHAQSGLRNDNIQNLIIPFQSFMEFQENIGIPPKILTIPPYHVKLPIRSNSPRLKKQDFHQNYLVGTYEIDDIVFIILNSAWFSRDSDLDDGKMWIGRNIISLMNQVVSFPVKLEEANKVFIAIQHHTEDCLQEDERMNNNGAFNYILKSCHFLLMGHKHNNDPLFERKYLCGDTLRGGAAYQGLDYDNNCTILQLNKTTGVYKARKLTWNRRNWEFPKDLIGNSIFLLPTQSNLKVAQKYIQVQLDGEYFSKRTTISGGNRP